MNLMHLPTLILLLATVVLAPLPIQAGTVTVKGSDTMVILAQKWAATYMAQTSATKIQVTGGGSGTGFAALQNRTTDLCNASRRIKAREIEACIRAFGKRPTEHKVALDGLCVYVHSDNPIESLSLPQLQQIFTGKIRNWSQLGGPNMPITLYSRENSSGTYEFFKEHVLQGADFATSAQTMPGTAALLQAVAKDKTAVGYGGSGYGAGAKHLKIKKTDTSAPIDPTEVTVLNGTYPISRYLYIYVNPELEKAEIAAYLAWMRSDAGQAAVRDVGYYPLPQHLRHK